MSKREKTSLSLNPDLMIAVSRRCLDLRERGLRIDKSDALEEALQMWLNQHSSDPLAAGEFVKCPSHIRDIVQKMIIRLHAMDSAMLPAMERLLIKFSEPGVIEDILSEEGKRALLGPRAVAPRKTS